MPEGKMQETGELEIEKPNDRACEYSNEEEEDTSSSDLKWDLMSITSAQSGTGMARFDTIEDVSHAIDACKKAILETIENTDSRKEMVLRLIQLRIRFEDMKERANVASNINSSLETRGHVFISLKYRCVECDKKLKP